MGVLTVELGVPYTGWPVRAGLDYEFGLGLVSDELREEILVWAQSFNLHHDEERGWASTSDALAHELRGRVLRDRLQAELGDGYQVRLTPSRTDAAEDE